MPKKSESLLSTDREVAGAKLPLPGRKAAEYRIAGSPNLVLRVWSSGRRTWVCWLKRRKVDRWSKYTIGAYPIVTLALAKQESQRLARSIIEGVDPVDSRNAEKHAFTVKALGEAYLKRHAKPKKRSWREDERKLKKEIYPTIGNVKIEHVTKVEIVEMLNAIMDRGAPIQANRTHALVRKVFNFAVAEGYLERSPAYGIPVRAQERVRTRILSPSEIGEFWPALDGDGFEDVTADALRLQLLLGARVREITGMDHKELALGHEPPLWTLPKERAKGNRAVPRPLPPRALGIIQRRLKAIGNGSFVFASPANPERPLTPRAPSRALQRARVRHFMPAGVTPHDLRRTCRSELARLGVPEIVAKKILGHAPRKSDVTEAVYNLYQFIPEMMDALTKWEVRIEGLVRAHENAVIRP